VAAWPQPPQSAATIAMRTVIRQAGKGSDVEVWGLSDMMAFEYGSRPLTDAIQKPRVGVVMGSKSDWEIMSHAVGTLEELGLAADVRVLSAHRSPNETIEWASSAEERGLDVIIAAAGGAAHLAGVVAGKSVLPVLGVPMQTKSRGGRGAPRRRREREDHAAGAGRADEGVGPGGARFTPLDRADASGNSRGNAGDRAGGCRQRGAACGGDHCAE
jgi:hypothetical protein